MPDYRKLAAASARKYGIDPAIFTRKIAAESSFNPNARSSAGALGIAQFEPATAAAMGINPLDPVQALDASARMDAANLKKYGNYKDVLSIYNSGRGWATGQHIPETRNYVDKILGGLGNPQMATAAPSVSPRTTTPGPATPQIGGSPQRQALLANLLGSLNSFAQTGNAMNVSNPQAFLGAALQKVLTTRVAGDQAAQAAAPPPTAPVTAPSMGPVSASHGLKLEAVPHNWSTRGGIDVNQAILPHVVGIAERFGVKVNSGYRSAEHNAAVGGAKNSDHLSGNAVDFTGSEAAMRKLYEWAQKQGFPYVEPWSQAGGNHVHISFIR